ncbi:MAG: hypothetical protein HC767_09100 [Akkermansiaceae bacterium]|nr:hypothetical protein [Akkermansiaceae bacterium]
MTKNRVLALNEGWVKKKLEHAGPDGEVYKWVKDETKDYWAKRLKGMKEYMPEELNKPEFELQQLAAAAQRGELDAAGMEVYKNLRAGQRETQRSTKRAEREELRSRVVHKYGRLRGAAKVDALGP